MVLAYFEFYVMAFRHLGLRSG